MTATPFSQPSALKGSPDPEGGDGAYSFDGKPDRWKRYRLPDPETGKPGGYTRMTTFAKSISDTYALSMWSLRMGGKGLAMRPDLYARVASTSLDERETLNNLMEEAKNAAGSKVGANLGTALHAFSEAIDRGEKPNIPPPYQPHMHAYTALMEKYALEMVDIEQVVLCQTYGIAGTFDRLVRFTKDITVELVGGHHHESYTFRKGRIAVLDLKTGKDLEYGWLEISIQLAGYANSELIWDKDAMAYRMMPPEVDRKVALVVHLPATAPGETVKATMYAVNIEEGWEEADLCHKVREARKKKGRATALSVVEEASVVVHAQFDPTGNPEEDAYNGDVPRVVVEDVVRPPTLIERAKAAKTEDDLTTIWWEAIRTRQATSEMSAAIKTRRMAILADTAAG